MHGAGYSCHFTVPARRNLLGREPGQGLSTASLRLSMSTSVTYTNPAVFEFSSSCAGRERRGQQRTEDRRRKYSASSEWVKSASYGGGGGSRG